jgi:hypothetical protein
VFIRAPGNATETERFDVLIQAFSKSLNASLASIKLTAVVTGFKDIPDEEDSFTADADTLERVNQRSGGKSPGVPALWMVLALAGLATARMWHGRGKR